MSTEFVAVECGRKSERPKLAKAIAECKRKKATLVIARLDRLARNVAFIAGLMESKVQFVACDMPEATPFMLHIYAAVAQEEARVKIEHAKRLGAHAVFQAEKDNVVKAILEGTAGRGVDVVLEAAGTLATVEESMRISRHGGTAVLIGIPPEDRYEFSASFARHRGLTIKLCRRMKHTYPRGISLTSSGKVDPGSLVTHRFPLEKVEDSLKLVDAYADGVVKAVIEIPEDRG